MEARIGYACLTIGVPDTDFTAVPARLATPGRLREATAHNLRALENMIAYNARSGIRLFRISSGLVPFGSSPLNTMPWQQEFAPAFERIGKAIARADIRVSMHPGQYTVLNSPDEEVARRAADDLVYHETVLRLLGTDFTNKIILHVGGVYGDKQAAMQQFRIRWEHLPADVRHRVVLENDERLYNSKEVLGLALELGVPAAFDVLHHAINPPADGPGPEEWVRRYAATWKEVDGRQKIHYSQQSPDSRPGAHSATVKADEFRMFCHRLGPLLPDIMLEVKDKNVSAVKCMNVLFHENDQSALQREWERYRLRVLEQSPEEYDVLERMALSAEGFNARVFYMEAERAALHPVEAENAARTAETAWKMVPSTSEQEYKRFAHACGELRNGRAGTMTVKKLLLRLAREHSVEKLESSLYLADALHEMKK